MFLSVNKALGRPSPGAMLTVSVLVRQPVVLGLLLVEGVGPREALLLPEVLVEAPTLLAAAQLKLVRAAQAGATTIGGAKERRQATSRPALSTTETTLFSVNFKHQ